MVKRFDVYLVNLDLTQGVEIKKTRQCLVISPNEVNNSLNTLLVAPMTSAVRHYPTRVQIIFQGVKGEIALDQLRAVDKSRLVKRLGKIHAKEGSEVLDILQEMFAE